MERPRTRRSFLSDFVRKEIDLRLTGRVRWGGEGAYGDRLGQSPGLRFGRGRGRLRLSEHKPKPCD
jgi:hypothetical protein